MRISIYNFKSIKSLTNYELQPFNILSGTNSSGKSSFIQLLLLLKQTMELDSAQYPLYLEGKLFTVGKYSHILSSKAGKRQLKVKLVFSKEELKKYQRFQEFSYYDVFDNYELSISIEFDLKEGKCYVSLFDARFIIPDTAKPEQYIKVVINSDNYDIETNVAVFSNKELYEKQGFYKIQHINCSAFIPSGYEIEYTDGDGTIFKEVFKLDGIKSLLKDFFSSLSYIGPSRDEPKEEYRNTGNFLTVGIHGEYVAEVLERNSTGPHKFLTINEENETIDFIEQEGTFLDAVRYWICDRFNLCSDIIPKKTADSYFIHIRSFTGVETTIRHVGFGISQILPIIVEGLRLTAGETLILEQPEIHLHPKVQSQLFDFLMSLVQQGKRVIVETHSDHLITRLRRRIAEDPSNMLNHIVSLTFVEPSQTDLVFRNIGIDDFGGLDYFPEDFIEKVDVELKAILKAQMKKRLNQKEQ